MPSKSKAQQKFMGMVHSLQKGDMKPSDASPEVKKAAKSMDKTDAKDYASTSHKGLPKKVKQEIARKLKEYANKMGRDHLGGDDIPSPNKGGLRDNDGYDNVDYNKDMPVNESAASLLLLTTAILQLVTVLAKANGGMDMSENPFKALWSKIKDTKDLFFVKRIAKRLQDDEEIKDFLKLTWPQQKGKWQKLLLTKLKAVSYTHLTLPTILLV